MTERKKSLDKGLENVDVALDHLTEGEAQSSQQWAKNLTFSDLGVGVYNLNYDEYMEYIGTMNAGLTDQNMQQKTVKSEDGKHLMMKLIFKAKYVKDIPRWERKATGQDLVSVGVQWIDIDEEGKCSGVVLGTRYYFDGVPDGVETVFKEL